MRNKPVSLGRRILHGKFHYTIDLWMVIWRRRWSIAIEEFLIWLPSISLHKQIKIWEMKSWRTSFHHWRVFDWYTDQVPIREPYATSKLSHLGRKKHWLLDSGRRVLLIFYPVMEQFHKRSPLTVLYHEHWNQVLVSSKKQIKNKNIPYPVIQSNC